MDRPKLRPLEVIPARQGAQQVLALRDPAGVIDGVVVVPAGLGLLLSLLDGEHTIADIQAAIVAHTHEFVTGDHVRQIINQLDKHHVLEGDRFERHRAERLAAFREGGSRPASHAGQAYEADPQRLGEQLQGLFEHADGPGLPQGEGATPRVCGVVSPHIDLQRGGPTFAWAYKEVAERCDAELFVILGTAHVPTRHRFVLTRLDFETPLGVVRTDREFVDRLADLAGPELFDDELVHRCEHSVEFQVIFLQHVLGTDRPFTIVPILAGSFQDLVDSDGDPAADPGLRRFVSGLSRASAECGKRVAYVTGADLSHVGEQFGDPGRLSDDFLAEVQRDDLAMLDAAERLDERGFFESVRKDGDRRRICGLPPLYTMLSVLGSRDGHTGTGKVLRYDQAVDDARACCVSFASMAFYDGDG